MPENRANNRNLLVDRTAIAFCLAAVLYVTCGFVAHVSPKVLVPLQLQPARSGQPKLSGQAFALDSFSNLARPPYLKGSLDIYGSFLDGGDSMGSVHTATFTAVPDFYLFVAGFPNRPGNLLRVEVNTADGRTVNIQGDSFEDPSAKWVLKRISLHHIPGATSFRIVATDGNKGPEGWFAFSAPFEDQQSYGRSGLLFVKQLGFCLLALSAAFVALLAPGFLLRHRFQQRHGFSFSAIWLPVPGMTALALLAVLAWVGPRPVKSVLICRIVLALFFLFATRQFFRIRFSTLVTRTELQVLLVIVALTSICFAKSLYSLGPVGELYHDEVSRTLEIGGRSDSSLPYYVAQLVATRDSPTSPFARELYATWSFSDRGQFVALAVAPLVLAGPTRIPGNRPYEVWTVFDPTGFAAYRASMIVFTACCLWFVFGIALLFLPEDWSLFAVMVCASAPFFVHETYFTWPKIEAAGFVLLAAYLVLRSRFLLGGLALGFGYLCHPSALLSAPAIFAVIFLEPGFSVRPPASLWFAVRRSIRNALLVSAGLAMCLLFWRVVNGSHYTQGQFAHFMVASGDLAQTIPNWLDYRFTSLLNTFVPLDQFLFHASDPNVNSVEGPSPAIVRFFVQPWSTVPFAVGFLYYFCLWPIVGIGFLRARNWVVWTLLIPVLIFAAYMGIDESGMLKEGLHAWVLTLLLFSVVMLKKYGAGFQTFWRVCNWALLSRAFDLLAMMVLPAIWTQHSIIRPPFVLTDVLALVTMVAGTLWLCLAMYRLGEKLRRQAAAAS